MKQYHIDKVKKNFGVRYGKLIIIDYLWENKRGGFYKCKCDCGNITTTDISRLKKGTTTSCGCYRKEKLREMIASGEKECVRPVTKHGLRNNRLYIYYLSLKKQGLNVSIEDFIKKYDVPSLILENMTAKYINGEVIFMKKNESKKIKRGYILDGKISSLEDIKKIFGITRELGLKIISANINTTNNILEYIKQYKINNRGMTEYKGELYTCKQLEDLHKELTGEYIESHTLKDRFRRYGYDKNSVIEGKQDMSKSAAELNILNYIKSIYSGTVISGYRGLNGLGIDIYLPELNMGFEYNGIFFHQTLTPKFISSIGYDIKRSKYSSKDTRYHNNKKILAKDRGIDLYTIWEDQYKNKKEIIYNFINNKLGLIKNKIYARKCIIQEISSIEYLIFCENNHIQGAGGLVSISYGLIYEGNIVGVAGFSNDELKRYCTKLGTNVIGGFSKILHYYISKNNPKEIKTFADFDVVSIDNNIYKKMGFVGENIGITYNYFKYSDGGYKRYHKALFRKNKISKKFGYIFNEGETEYEAMEKLGYIRCYNSGIQRYILKV